MAAMYTRIHPALWGQVIYHLNVGKTGRRAAPKLFSERLPAREILAT